MRVVHVVPYILDRVSGPVYYLESLCRELIKQQCETSLYVLDGVPSNFPESVTCHVFKRWRFPKRLGISPKMRRALCDEAASWDLIHDNSLWMMPNIYAGDAARIGKKPLVVSPHGTMAKWAWNRSRWRKALIGWAGQYQTLAAATCFHATAQAEWRDIRALGYRQPVAVIPIGVDIPERGKVPQDRTRLKRLLYAGRLHPQKGLVNLIRAWAALASDFEDWELRVVGPNNNGFGSDLERLARELGCLRIVFEGALYGHDLSRAYQEASLYVLPTFSENFGVTVAEALANGTPVIVTRGAPWSDLVRERCGWWIEVGEKPLVSALREAMTVPEQERQEMGRRGRAWMGRDFSWNTIGGMMKHTYEWVLGGGDMPGWVETG